MAFGRIIELYIGETSSSKKLKITDLKIEFEVDKDPSKDETNKAKISIYNLSDNTANRLSEAGNFIEIRAGYKDEDNVASIFMGEITKCEREREESNLIVKIEAMDSRTQFLESRLSISYAKNTPVLTVVNEITNIIGLGVSGKEKIPNSEKYTHGYSYIGLAQDCLTEVLDRIGLEWKIQNEHIYILNPNENIKEVGYNLTQNTGLLTIPTPVSDNTDSLPMGVEIPNAWKFKCILLPDLMPDVICKVESRTLNSRILIQKVKLKGTNYGDEFFAEVEGVEP